eukprot:TRINITY_DN66017_c0_g1_i1.p1 TRINITY_DN66017_c0_g1~~TRINITY_DN66017_c0_g1_i1.p1  ORF type:complete len:312 (+),score=32.86 TRINITY_DN66017_c0_g1_i1:137-1072(+)
MDYDFEGGPLPAAADLTRRGAMMHPDVGAQASYGCGLPTEPKFLGFTTVVDQSGSYATKCVAGRPSVSSGLRSTLNLPPEPSRLGPAAGYYDERDYYHAQDWQAEKWRSPATIDGGETTSQPAPRYSEFQSPPLAASVPLPRGLCWSGGGHGAAAAAGGNSGSSVYPNHRSGYQTSAFEGEQNSAATAHTRREEAKQAWCPNQYTRDLAGRSSGSGAEYQEAEQSTRFAEVKQRWRANVAWRANVVSLGSAGHASGECRPCAHFWRPEGCNRGDLCERCHLCPPTAFREYRQALKADKRSRDRTIRQRASH